MRIVKNKRWILDDIDMFRKMWARTKFSWRTRVEHRGHKSIPVTPDITCMRGEVPDLSKQDSSNSRRIQETHEGDRNEEEKKKEFVWIDHIQRSTRNSTELEKIQYDKKIIDLNFCKGLMRRRKIREIRTRTKKYKVNFFCKCFEH